MYRLLLATHNAGKIREYRHLLADLPLGITTLEEEGITLDVAETGETFAENAILKARAYAQLSGLWTWADDSGLEVDALDGQPGVYSARYAGPGASDSDRYNKLLDDLAETAPGDRTARFRCVVALAFPDNRVMTAEGTLEGVIAHAPQGNQGFGYDPVFFLPAYQKTLGQLSPQLKNEISHRARASHAARRLLQDALQSCSGER